MKTLTRFLNENESNCNRLMITEAGNSVTIEKVSREIVNLFEEYNSINERIMKAYIEAVQNCVKQANLKNIEKAIQKWLKKYDKSLKDEINGKQYNNLLDYVTLECLGLTGRDTPFVSTCSEFDVSSSSVDKLDIKFSKARMKTYKKIFG